MSTAAWSPLPANLKPFQAAPLARAGWVVLIVYLAWAMSSLDFNYARFITGLDHGAK